MFKNRADFQLPFIWVWLEKTDLHSTTYLKRNCCLTYNKKCLTASRVALYCNFDNLSEYRRKLYENQCIEYKRRFGAAFEIGRHEWFALRRLITNSRSSAFTGSFLKETSQEDRRNKNWTLQRLLHGTLRLRYSPTGEKIQNGRTADEIPRDPITPWCSPPLVCPCFSLAETSVLKISQFPFTKYSSCLLTLLLHSGAF